MKYLRESGSADTQKHINGTYPHVPAWKSWYRMENVSSHLI